MSFELFDAYDSFHWLNEPVRKYAESLRTYCGTSEFKNGMARYLEGLADMYERSTRIVKKQEFNID